jgi:LPXTG-motif cell wall-anchored protein
MILHKKSSPKYKNSPEHKDESEWTTAEKHIKSYIKKQNKDALLRTEVDGWTDIEIPVKNPSSNPTNWTLIISLGLIVVGVLLVGLIIFLKKRKRS